MRNPFRRGHDEYVPVINIHEGLTPDGYQIFATDSQREIYDSLPNRSGITWFDDRTKYQMPKNKEKKTDDINVPLFDKHGVPEPKSRMVRLTKIVEPNPHKPTNDGVTFSQMLVLPSVIEGIALDNYSSGWTYNELPKPEFVDGFYYASYPDRHYYWLPIEYTDCVQVEIGGAHPKKILVRESLAEIEERIAQAS